MFAHTGTACGPGWLVECWWKNKPSWHIVNRGRRRGRGEGESAYSATWNACNVQIAVAWLSRVGSELSNCYGFITLTTVVGLLVKHKQPRMDNSPCLKSRRKNTKQTLWTNEFLQIACDSTTCWPKMFNAKWNWATATEQISDVTSFLIWIFPVLKHQFSNPGASGTPALWSSEPSPCFSSQLFLLTCVQHFYEDFISIYIIMNISVSLCTFSWI